MTEDSNGVAAATLPNVCKMPGPPAPFVPTPLPNIGKSGTDPKGYSKSVTIEGKKVAIRGATFGSTGDVASKGTGGGLVSSNVEGPTRFVGPGSMDVKIEGKNVQLLGDPMLNNCGPRGSPANAATLMGLVQKNGDLIVVTGEDACPACRKTHGSDVTLKETPVTKADAAQLANKLDKNVHDAEQYPQDQLPWKRMLGVAHCKCGRTYADHSSETQKIFCKSVEDLGKGWLTSAEGNSKKSVEEFLKDKLQPHPNRQERLNRAWALADLLFRRKIDNRLPEEVRKKMPGVYPPGSCAGPKTLVLALQDKAYITGLTERWFASNEEPVGSKIKFRDSDGEVVERVFAHGKSVPPCQACNLILPFILCPEDKEKKCPHPK